MKKTAIAASIAAALIAASGSAFSFQLDNSQQWGLSVLGGIYHTDSTRNMSDSGFGGVRVFYNINQYFNLGGLFGVLGPENKSTNKSSIGFLSMAEAQIVMPMGGRVIPHFEVGVGDLKVNSNELAGDVGFGVSYYFSQSFNVGFDYRAIQQFNDDYTDQLVTLTGTWTFGGSQHNQAVEQKPLTAQQQAMLHKAQKSLHYVLPDGVRRCSDSNSDLNSGCVTFNGNKMTMHLYVQFKQNKFNIRQEYAQSINRLGSFMKQYSSTDARLKGYASIEGPAAFNQWLSNQRAQAVKQYLIQRDNIAAHRLTAKGFGTAHPIANNNTEYGRELNRRVQAQVTVPAKLVS